MRYLDRKTHVTQANISGRDPFIQNSDRSDRKKWSTSKGGPVISKLFRLDRTDPLSFGPKFPEIRARSTDNIPFATLTVPIMQFVFPTKFFYKYCFQFSLERTNRPLKIWKQNLWKIMWGRQFASWGTCTNALKEYSADLCRRARTSDECSNIQNMPNNL